MYLYSHLDDRSSALELIPGFQRWAENQADVFGAYLVTWITFNAIYVAEYNRPYAVFKKKEDGSKIFVDRYKYGFAMVDVKKASERDMILCALRKLPRDIRQELIKLSLPDNEETCLEFFANRIPIWQGVNIEQDARGQSVNGVINVRETISTEYPHWIPVDSTAITIIMKQLKNGENIDVPDRLICQLGDILYTVRNNLFHGCKGLEDSNDRQVLNNSYKLLKFVVDFYLNWENRS